MAELCERDAAVLSVAMPATEGASRILPEPMNRRIARNTLYNLAGYVLPAAIALVTVPLYLHRIGNARYGVLAILWLVVGYFGAFDIGLSRATGNMIARLHAASPEERQSVFWTATLLNAGFGIVGGICLWTAGAIFLPHISKIPSALHGEVHASLPWIAAAIPLATLGGVMTGTLEARGQFLQVNSVAVFGSALYQVLPLTVAYIHSPSLAWLIPAVILARVASFGVLLIAAMRSLPITHLTGPSRQLVRPLLSYGGWVTLSNVVGPILGALDQLMVGTMVGVAVLPWYTVPFSLASRLQILPSALIRTLFPEFSKMQHSDSSEPVNRSFRLTAGIFSPIIAAALLLTKPFLTVWLGSEFAAHASPIGLIFLPGVWMNAIAFIPFIYLQAKGRPDITAHIHVLELAPFVALLWVFLRAWGPSGAAMCWTIRVLADAVLLIWAAHISKEYLVDLWPSLLFLGGAWALATWLPFSSVVYWLAASALVICTATWALLLDPALWHFFRHGIGRVKLLVS
jgi:O-antigen/teichoic acid export membrane protein